VTENVNKLVAHIRSTVDDLSTPLSGAAYGYSSLPLCVVDAVFSIGVRYQSTERTVSDFCARYHWQKDGRARTGEERTISDFLLILQPYEDAWESMAKDLFHNRQRTSSRSGILKAEAVYRFSKTLQCFGVETFAEALRFGVRDDLVRAIKAIPGQASGLSYSYFLILAGNLDGVKADRMVTRFVANALGVRKVSPELAEELVRKASALLQTEFPTLFPSTLDNKIWKYQRSQHEASEHCCH
jgi:hypothetical protein